MKLATKIVAAEKIKSRRTPMRKGMTERDHPHQRIGLSHLAPFCDKLVQRTHTHNSLLFEITLKPAQTVLQGNGLADGWYRRSFTAIRMTALHNLILSASEESAALSRIAASLSKSLPLSV
jgi:hypothetical protein